MYQTVILLVYGTMALSLLPALFKGGKVENHRLLTVYLTPQQEKDPEVLALQKRYRQNSHRFVLLYLLAALPQLFLFSWPSLTMIWLLLWTFGGVAAFQLQYNRSRREMIALAQEKGWRTVQRKVVTVDTTLSKMKLANAISPWWFLGLLPLEWLIFRFRPQGSPGLFFWSSLIVGLLMLLLFFLTRRVKGRILSKDSRINQLIDRRYRRGWCLFWLLCALCQGGMALGMELALPQMGAGKWILWYGSLFIALIPLVYLTAFLVGQKRYEGHLLNLKDQEEEVSVSWDDPQGMSNALFVPKAVGIGFTFNTNTPAGRRALKIVYVCIAVLVIPLCGVLLAFDFAGHSMKIEDRTVEFQCPLYGSTLELDQVQEIYLMEELPQGGFKNNGAATDSYARGHFQYPDFGNCLVYVYRQSSPVIVLRTKDQFVFYNEKDPQATQDQWKALQTAWEQLP